MERTVNECICEHGIYLAYIMHTYIRIIRVCLCGKGPQ